MSSLKSLPILKPRKVESTETLPKSDKELERLRKIRERIIRNRASANASRQKKKEYVASLEKKNKELTQHTEKMNKENQKLKNENENLKLQIQYLSQTLNKMNNLINENNYKNNKSINNNIHNSTQVQNMFDITTNNGIYSSPIIENNFTSGINFVNQLNSPESLSSSSPLFNDMQSSIPSTNNDITNIMNSNVNTYINNMNALPLQSSVGEPAALTNENSLQRSLLCRRIMQQILETVILTKFLTNFLMATLNLIQTSSLRPQNNNNSYKNLYQKRDYIQPVPISVQNQTMNSKQQEMNYHKNNYFKYWNNKYTYWKDRMS
ncbi:hypothetical protein H8356DRAFT_1299216 [Neocallimastix lanati (nom. inval.)]|jgi:cell division protein FtsB|uniref:BZIP domain-containing protein n=1 Tax=Neocallimastix californiae TaxID=1754190 RepID=A0A1Y1ZRN5_9FUNG|nr:hypothetical protein H8356DRAFT_1299216 [Neocallimastix sp. JGI-2020a]ORY12896.1 hypothetical protein LY90DRAFT_186953 [Neocallimastix californiae]|eukprot:ORY12896.1 hypothetical protein LY90DRAFT_186953 [Neocallimastix californiae]